MCKFYLEVIGSRSFENWQLLYDVLDDYLSTIRKTHNVIIISGGAQGADYYAKQYAQDRGFGYREFPANWAKFGKSAGYKRNYQMMHFISSYPERACIAFWDGKSRGTTHSFQLAKDMNVKLHIVRF